MNTHVVHLYWHGEAGEPGHITACGEAIGFEDSATWDYHKANCHACLSVTGHRVVTGTTLGELDARIEREKQERERQFGPIQAELMREHSAAVIEALAAYSHAAWAHWMEYMFSKGFHAEGHLEWMLPHAFELRWTRQMLTHYDKLPESEKASDRDEARKILDVILRTLGHVALTEEASDAQAE
jgi:hypothetical protein